MAKIDVRPDGCWLWRAALNEKGYGMFNHHGMKRAHRVAYAHWKGEIPSGLVVDHICFQKRCVNPEHLQLLTNRENLQRSWALKTHCPHGHPYSGTNLYCTPVGHRRCRVCRNQHALDSKARNRGDTPINNQERSHL